MENAKIQIKRRAYVRVESCEASAPTKDKNAAETESSIPTVNCTDILTAKEQQRSHCWESQNVSSKAPWFCWLFPLLSDI